MKLYTEEHLKIFYNLGKVDGFIGRQDDVNELIKNYPPIELPSDEDIREWAKMQSLGEPTGAEEFGRIYGAKWMLDLIQGGSK